MVLLEQTTQALSMLENENGRLSQVKLKKKNDTNEQTTQNLTLLEMIARDVKMLYKL
jgi:hypothetical protein